MFPRPGAGVEEARQGPGGLGSSVRGTPKAQAASAQGQHEWDGVRTCTRLSA